MHKRYSSSLRAECSWNRILVGARFSTPHQTCLGSHPAPCTMGTGSFPGQSGLGVALTTQRLSARSCREAAARLLRLCIRIPPGAWMFVCSECCVLSGRGLCDELISRPEEAYRMVRRCVRSRSLVNEEAFAHWGLSRQDH